MASRPCATRPWKNSRLRRLLPPFRYRGHVPLPDRRRRHSTRRGHREKHLSQGVTNSRDRPLCTSLWPSRNTTELPDCSFCLAPRHALLAARLPRSTQNRPTSNRAKNPPPNPLPRSKRQHHCRIPLRLLLAREAIKQRLLRRHPTSSCPTNPPSDLRSSMIMVDALKCIRRR